VELKQVCLHYHRTEDRGDHRTGPVDHPHRTGDGGRSMNISFTPEPMPKLTITGIKLAELGFGLGEPLQLTLRLMGCGSPS